MEQTTAEPPSSPRRSIKGARIAQALQAYPAELRKENAKLRILGRLRCQRHLAQIHPHGRGTTVLTGAAIITIRGPLANLSLVQLAAERADTDDAGPLLLCGGRFLRRRDPMTFRFTRAIALAATAAVSVTTTALAQDNWPDGPLEVVMHTKPGGTSDIFIRTLAQSLEPQIGQPIVVTNAPGGGGATQMAKVRSAKADGLTLGINTLTHFTSMQTNLKGTFSPDDFSWIASVQEDPILFFVREDSPYQTFADVIAAARENPATISIGGFGPVGSMQHIGTSILENATDTKFNWIGYESTPDILTALLGGHVDIGVSNLGPTAPYFEAGRIRGLGVLNNERLEGLPELATFGEQGIDVDTSWIQVRGVFGPKGMPMELQQQIADAFHDAMKADSYQNYARSTGVSDSWMGPADYSDFVSNISEVARTQLTAAGVLN